MPLDGPENSLWKLDCDQVDDAVAAELLRQAEIRQAAVFQAAIGMDQRASVLAAGFVAASGAVAAAGLTLSDFAVRAGALGGAVALAFVAGLCAWACRPQKFRFPGIDPLEWAADVDYLREPLKDLQIARAAQLQDHLAANETQQARNGRALSSALLLAPVAPLVATVIWWIAAKV